MTVFLSLLQVVVLVLVVAFATIWVLAFGSGSFISIALHVVTGIGIVIFDSIGVASFMLHWASGREARGSWNVSRMLARQGQSRRFPGRPGMLEDGYDLAKQSCIVGWKVWDTF